MKSNLLRNLLILVLVLILGAVGYFTLPGKRVTAPSLIATSTTPTTADLNESVAVASVSITDKNETKKYEINASYPNITGLKAKAVEKKINADIEAAVNSQMADFKKGQDDPTVEVGMPDNGPSTFNLNYSRITNAPHTNVLSFSVMEEYDSRGAAHPGHSYLSLNYDLVTGKRLALKDIFIGDYVNVLSNLSKSALKKKMGQDTNKSMVDDGAGPKEDNFKVFFPTSIGFKILFNEYQVAPYVAGPQEIAIPYSALKDVINRSGPLKDL